MTQNTTSDSDAGQDRLSDDEVANIIARCSPYEQGLTERAQVCLLALAREVLTLRPEIERLRAEVAELQDVALQFESTNTRSLIQERDALRADLAEREGRLNRWATVIDGYKAREAALRAEVARLEAREVAVLTDFANYACEGHGKCPAPVHVHGCYADRGSCNEPKEHGHAVN